MKKRSVILGMMSEICMKGRLLLSRLKDGSEKSSPEELKARFELMESEMRGYASELLRKQ